MHKILCLWACHLFFSVYRYPKAIGIFELVANQSIGNNLLRYGVKGHLLNAGLCHLCGCDSVAISNALEKYQVCLLLPSAVISSFSWMDLIIF